MENDNFEAAYEAEAQNNAYDDAWNDLNRLIAEKNKRSDLIAQDKPADNSVRIPVNRQPAAPARQGGDRPFFVPSKADRDRGEGGVFGNAAQALVNGAVEGVNNTLEAAYQAAIFWDQNFGDKVMPAELPDIPKPFDVPDTTVNTIVSTIGQFVVPFSAAGKAMGAAKLGTNVAASFPKAAKIARPMIQGAIADFSAFDGHEARLSNLIESVPALQNPVSEYLAASEDDYELEGRFKNAVEGLGVGAAADGLFKCLSAVKAARKARRIAKEENLKPVEERFVPKVAKEDLSALGDPDGKLLVKSAPKDDIPQQAAAIGESTAHQIDFKSAVFNLSDERRAHIEEHLGQIKRAGFDNVDDYINYISENYDAVYSDPAFSERYWFTVTESGNHNNLMVVEAVKNEKTGAFDIITAFPRRKNAFKDKKNLLSERAQSNHSQGIPQSEALTGQKQISNKSVSKPAESVNINFARIDTPDDIKKVMAELADASRESIDKARRGKMTFGDIEQAAKKWTDGQEDAFKILQERRVGEPLNAEQSFAARQLWAAASLARAAD